MTDVVNSAFAVIFIGILLMVGIIVFAYASDPMSDEFWANETLSIVNCSTGTTSTCVDEVDHTPIENETRAVPVLYNCTWGPADAPTDPCDVVDAAEFAYYVGNGTIFIHNDASNGSLKISYWQDNMLGNDADLAQQSISSTAYGGFDLGAVMIIVMAAVAIIGSVFLIGKREV